MSDKDYGRWASYSKATPGGLAAMARQAAGFAYRPRISILMAVSDPDEVWIKDSIDSVSRQAYPRLELCVCDDLSERPHVAEVLDEYADREERMKVLRPPGKAGRAGSWNAALSAATGEFVVLLDPGDELAPEALFKVAESLQHVGADAVYTDEDRMDVAGERADPLFKPPWSPELLLSAPFTGRLCAVRRDLVEAAGGFRQGLEGAEEHDLMLRVSEKTDRIRHLPGVLYHRRVMPWEPPAPAGTNDAPLWAVEEALARREEDATAEPDADRGGVRVRRRPRGRPTVSVVFSAAGETDGAALLEDEERALYPVHQVIEAGGAGDASGARADAGTATRSFPARALNLAAEEADGDYLVFAEGCAGAPTPGWLSEMLGQAGRWGVGAVGGRMLGPDGDLLHDGFFADMSRLLGHPDKPPAGEAGPPSFAGYVSDVLAVSAGCMILRRDLFEEAGGFDDENLPGSFYDWDLSFRLRGKGLRLVYTPYVSFVGGGDRGTEPGEGEVAHVWGRWWAELVSMLHYGRSPVLRAAARDEVTEEALLAAISS